MTTDLPQKLTPAPIRSKAWVWIAITGIAVLVVSLVMAYREITRSMAPGHDATATSSNTTGFVFNIYPQPRTLPDFRFTDGNGRAMALRDFRGKVVLLNVWATWCPPCRQEMPTLDRLQDKLGGPDFQVAALSIDQGRQRLNLIQEFYRQSGIKSLAIYMDASGDASRDLAVAGLPTTLLIDREGREMSRKIGPAEWDSPEIITLISGYVAPSTSSLPAKP